MIDRTGFRNAISNEPGLTPCGLARVRGLYLTGGVWETINSPEIGDLPLPLSFGSVEAIRVNGVPAGIVSVANTNGEESIVFQTPCEAAAPDSFAVVTVKIVGLDEVRVTEVPVVALQRRRLAVQPPVVSLLRGNEGQRVVAEVIAGVNDEGATVTRAFYAPGRAGVYIVEIELPATVAPGPGLERVYSPTTYLNIEE